MNEEQKKSIIESGKKYFRTVIIPKHVENLKGLKLDDFNINPFLINYLASFLCGNTEPESLAKALIYPRVLGTSINTSFGQNIQIFISQLSEVTGGASGIDGIDIEFIDAIDGRKKYCQCKAQINGINELTTVLYKCKRAVAEIGKDNWVEMIDDVVVCSLFGEKENLSKDFRTVATTYPVLCGAEFWEHFTGDKFFYYRLLSEFCKMLDEEHLYDELVKTVVQQITAA